VDFLTEVGIGLAIGMLAGTTGTHGSALGRMTLLAAVIAFVAGLLLNGIGGALLAAAGAVLGCVVISDVVHGARRRPGSGAAALAFIVALAALIVVAAALLFAPLVLLAIIALGWLGISRHRRAQRKHAGLRILR
jgi:heme O synthase-like polyprenyltransferase